MPGSKRTIETGFYLQMNSYVLILPKETRTVHTELMASEWIEVIKLILLR